MKVAVHNVGSLGEIKDVDAYELPPEAWTSSLRMRCIDNYVISEGGTLDIYRNDGSGLQPTPRGALWMLPVSGGSNPLWLYPDETSCYATDGVTHSDVTRISGPYTLSAPSQWTGGKLGKIAIINSPEDVPQQWTNVARDDPSLAMELEDLENWDTNKRAGVVRTHRNYIIAGDIIESSVREAQMVMWSHVADVNDVPNSWLASDPTKDAGEYPLLDTNGAVKEFMPLLNELVVYKEDSTYLMRYIGGRFIWSFEPMFPAHGVLNTRCAKPTKDGSKHVVVTRDDIIIHDGREITSLLSGRMRKWLFERINPDYAHLSFLVPNYDDDEFWFFYVAESDTINTRPASNIKINIKTGSIITGTVGNEDPVTHVAYDYIQALPDAGTYDGQGTQFNQTQGIFGARIDLPLRRRLVGVRETADSVISPFFLMNEGFGYEGGPSIVSNCRRTGLALVGTDRQGNPKSDVRPIKQFLGVWPRMSINGGTFCQIQVGVQQNIDGPTEWSYATFYPLDEESVQFNLEGRLLTIRFVAWPGTIMKINSYEVEFEVVGEY